MAAWYLECECQTLVNKQNKEYPKELLTCFDPKQTLQLFISLTYELHPKQTPLIDPDL